MEINYEVLVLVSVFLAAAPWTRQVTGTDLQEELDNLPRLLVRFIHPQ
jgi:hypothetical protein